MHLFIAHSHALHLTRTRAHTRALEYVRRLQHLVERKDRRDKWDRIYFQEQVDGEASA